MLWQIFCTYFITAVFYAHMLCAHTAGMNMLLKYVCIQVVMENNHYKQLQTW